MRALAISAEQPAGRPRRDQASGAQPLSLQFWLQQEVYAGMYFSSSLLKIPSMNYSSAMFISFTNELS